MEPVFLGIGALGFNLPALVAQLINFVLLLVIFRLLLYKPLLKMLDERKQRIQEGLEACDEAKRAPLGDGARSSEGAGQGASGGPGTDRAGPADRRPPPGRGAPARAGRGRAAPRTRARRDRARARQRHRRAAPRVRGARSHGRRARDQGRAGPGKAPPAHRGGARRSALCGRQWESLGDVIRDIAAKRYAEAAFLIAREDGKEDEWPWGSPRWPLSSAMTRHVRSSRTRACRSAQKLQLVERALAGVDPLVLNLARLLLRRRRTSLGPQIADAFQELVQESKGISHATVTSAVPLTTEDTAVTQRLREITGGEVSSRRRWTKASSAGSSSASATA